MSTGWNQANQGQNPQGTNQNQSNGWGPQQDWGSPQQGWNQNNQAQYAPQGSAWPGQSSQSSWAIQQNWGGGGSSEANQNSNKPNTQWGWGVQNQEYGSGSGFVIQTQQQANSKSWNQHSGWGVTTQKNQVPSSTPFYQQVLSQSSQQPTQQPYTRLFTPGIKIQQTTAQNQQSTQNSLKFDLSKEFIITTALDSSMVADVNKDQKNKNQLMLWKKHGESNQRYKLVPVNDRFMIISMESNLALEIEKSSPTKGALIVANQKTGSPNQLWQLVESKQPDGGYFIRTFCGKCWDLCEWKTSPGASIIQYDFNGGKNQIWHLKPF